MAGRTKIIEMVSTERVTSGVFGFSIEGEVRTPHEVPDYSPNAEDYAWAARELGDVPTRWVHGHRTMDDFPGYELGCAWDTVPVESLWRDGNA